MKRSDLDKKFTELAALYIADGWIINTNSMSGHQGEEGKLDLVKNDELIRIWLSKEPHYNWSKKDEWQDYTMHLRIGRWDHPAHECIDSWSTVWMKYLEVIYEDVFYEVTSKNGGWYITDLEEALAIQEKRHSNLAKHSYNSDTYLTSNRAKEIVTKYLKRKIGYKRVSYAKMTIKKINSRDHQHIAYRVTYCGNTYLIQ